MADQSPQDSSKPLDLKGPTPLVAVGVVLTIFLVALLIGNLWTSYSQSDQESAHETGLIEMAGRIALYDEILTMSCRMAAATGDTYWEERYYRYAPLLEELLQRALRLAPPAVGRPLAMTESANQRLVAMEEEALRLLKQGRADQARAILASAAYRSQKEAYGGSLSQALAVLHEHGNRRLAEHINRERWTLAAAMVAVVVLLLAWARVLLVVHRHQRESQRARRELDEHQVQLEEVVARRTGELEKANHELSLEVEQRRAAQEAHRRSEENYRAIFDSVNDAIFVHDPATGAILEANQRCIQMYGYTLAELRQRRAGDLSPGVEPYTPTAAAANLAQVMAGEPRLFEWRAKSKKGRLFWVEVSLKLARWNDRSVIMAVVRDISSRKEAEELLHIQQEQLRLFISHAPAAIAMFDDRMRYLLYSRRWLEDYGLGERDLTGLSHYEVFPEVPQRWKEVHNRCLSGAVERVEEEPFPRADGSLDWVRWEVRPWRDAQDEIGGVIMLTEVLTERKQVQDQLELSAKVFENSVEGVFVTDHQGVIQWVNRAFTIITGHSPEDAVGHTPRLLKSDRHPQEFYRAMWDSLVTNGEWRGEIWNRRKNGEAFLEWQTILAIRDDQGRPVRYVSIFYDITDIRQSEQQIEYQSNYDALTGLPNRTLLVDRMRVAFEHADRNGRQAALLSLDLDNFKHVNDGLGYASGDTLLQMVADRLAQPVGPEHTLSRPGGDEFLILVEEIEDARQAVRVAQWISTRLSQPFLLGGQEIFISVSIGIAVYPDDGIDPETMIKNADTALHQAKLQGKSGYSLFEPRLRAVVSERLLMENRLRRALEREEFLLHFQPKVNILDGGMDGMESLLRWQDSDEGLVPPGRFIPLAEETGLIVPIGEWVLRESCRQTQEWRQTLDADLRVAVNLSARQFREVDLVALVEEVLADTGLPHGCLELEVTESLVLENLEETVGVLRRLDEMGIKVTMDDFGTGYSSLSYLKRLPLSAIKIDKSFVRDIPRDPDDKAIVTTIISMAHNLGMKVIAEGVETADQLLFLRRHQCQCIQGYYFSRPVAAEAFAALIQDPGRFHILSNH